MVVFVMHNKKFKIIQIWQSYYNIREKTFIGKSLRFNTVNTTMVETNYFISLTVNPLSKANYHQSLVTVKTNYTNENIFLEIRPVLRDNDFKINQHNLKISRGKIYLYGHYCCKIRSRYNKKINVVNT